MSAEERGCKACGKPPGSDHRSEKRRKEVLAAYSGLRSAHAEMDALRAAVMEALKVHADDCKDKADRVIKAGTVEALKANIIRLRSEVRKARMRYVETSLEESALQEDLKLIREQVESLEASQALQQTIERGLTWQIQQLTPVAEAARWRRALEYFVMFPIEVQAPQRAVVTVHQTKASSTQKLKLQGISTISGFPLPNNGSFSDLPVEVVISTLAIIAQLLVFLSDELNIQLPNTVLPFETPEAALIAPHYNQSGVIALSPVRMDVLSLRTANPPNPQETGAVSDKVRDLAEDEKNLDFRTAFRLLCDNVLVLCARCGLKPTNLWPRAAILLNLHELHKLVLRACVRLEKQVPHHASFTDLPQELKRVVEHSPKLSENIPADEAIDDSQGYTPPAVRYRNQRPFSDERLGESYVVHVLSSEDLESSLHAVNAPENNRPPTHHHDNSGERSSDEGWALIEEQEEEEDQEQERRDPQHLRSPDFSMFRSALADSALFSSFFKS